jgi:hypothetical protein
VKLLDLDGEGITDALLPDQGSNSTSAIDSWDGIASRRVRAAISTASPIYSLQRSTREARDMTLVGLQDIVFVSAGGVDYWPYMGHGVWGKRVSMRLLTVVIESESRPTVLDIIRCTSLGSLSSTLKTGVFHNHPVFNERRRRQATSRIGHFPFTSAG